ncbi:hypothetical protein M0R45_026706 [Rubus argutus]|uniref:HMA domain-containing protein n=1 Tax=Rubus argutus TaxID=59490 RepID=A0AAW1X1T0_RUBAR
MNMKSSAATKKKMTMMPRGSCATLRQQLRYSRLVESRRFVNPADHGKKTVTLSSMIKKEAALNHHHHQHSKVKMSLQKTPQVLPSADNVFQVVVMRVALHCQGCAGKVKKHLSKMEGVTSFSIDLETKMVTVRGHVSAVGVMESISKVKKAELLLCS